MSIKNFEKNEWTWRHIEFCVTSWRTNVCLSWKNIWSFTTISMLTRSTLDTSNRWRIASIFTELTSFEIRSIFLTLIAWSMHITSFSCHSKCNIWRDCFDTSVLSKRRKSSFLSINFSLCSCTNFSWIWSRWSTWSSWSVRNSANETS